MEARFWVLGTLGWLTSQTGLGLAPSPFDEGEMVGTIIGMSHLEGRQDEKAEEQLIKDAGFDAYRVEVGAEKAEVVIDKGAVSEVVQVERSGMEIKKVSYYFRNREKIIARSKSYNQVNKAKIKERLKNIRINSIKSILRKQVAKILQRVDFTLSYLKRGGGADRTEYHRSYYEKNKNKLSNHREKLRREAGILPRNLRKQWKGTETEWNNRTEKMEVVSYDESVESRELSERIQKEISEMGPQQREIANRIVEGVTDITMISALSVTQQMIDDVRLILKHAAKDWM